MSIVVLDIETAPLPLSEAQTNYLTRDCREDEELPDAIGKAALSPFTGQVVCVGMLNPARARGRILSSGGTLYNDGIEITWDDGGGNSEEFVLRAAWSILKEYDTIVTFNGRGFDLPFLLHRSAILGVTPSRLDLMGYRYAATPHCDLLDQLSYYGATKRFPLALACEAYGIPSPKESYHIRCPACDRGLWLSADKSECIHCHDKAEPYVCDGSMVAELFAAGKHREIAEYNLADLRATAALYKIWRERLCKK